MRVEYFKRTWRFSAGVGAVLLVFTPLALLAPAWLRGYLIGGWVVFVGWQLWHDVVVESGSAAIDMGALAEAWTTNELKGLQKRGWEVMSHLVLRKWDIDHVAVGPGGLLVVQTKWRSSVVDFQDLRVEASKLGRDAEDVRAMIRARLGTAPTTVVLVIWGPGAWHDEAFGTGIVEGVTVLRGRKLGRLLSRLDDRGMSAGDVNSSWQTLQKHVEKRDAHDLMKLGRPRRSVSARLNELLLLALAGSCALEGSVLAFRYLHVPLSLVIAVAEVGLGAAALRARTLRRVAAAWLTGTALFWGLVAAGEILLGPQVSPLSAPVASSPAPDQTGLEGAPLGGPGHRSVAAGQ